MALDGRTKVLAAAGVALVMAGIAGLATLDMPPPGREAPSPHSAQPAAPAPSPESRIAAPNPQRIAVPDAWSAEDTLATAARRYRESSDLRDFYQRALAAGGMANLWYAQTALLRCYSVARFGIVGAEQRFASLGASEEIDAARKEAHRSWIQPCRGFETRPLLPGELQRVHTGLRDAPGLVGRAFRLETAGDTPPEERRALLREIVESGEGELIGTFGTGVADLRFGRWRYEQDRAAAEANRNIVAEQRAWMLAGCELGMDCGRGSLTWYNACVKSGDCSDGNAAQEAAAEAGREALPAILARRDEIVAAVKTRDWKALGL